MLNSISQEILQKLATIKESIDTLKSKLPKDSDTFEEMHKHPRSYYSHSVLQDIQGMNASIVKTIGWMNNPQFNEQGNTEIWTYEHTVELNLWQRKVFEHLMKTIMFSQTNTDDEYTIYLLYSTLGMFQSNAKDGKMLYKFTPLHLQEALTNWKEQIIRIQNEKSIQKMWFMRELLSENPKKESFMISSENLLEQVRGIKVYKYNLLFSLIGEYGNLSNQLHANLLFHTDDLDEGGILGKINNYGLVVLVELLILLFSINSMEIPNQLLDIGLNEDGAKIDFEQMYLKEFQAGQQVLHRLKNNELCTVIEKTESTDFSYNYLVEVNGIRENTPSFFLQLI